MRTPRNYRLPAGLLTRLSVHAERTGLTETYIVETALDEYLTRKERPMTRITCQPGESVFEAVDRAIAAGILPAGSTPENFRETCDNQVAVVEIRRGEQVPVRGPQNA